MQTLESIKELISKVRYKDWVFNVDGRSDCFTLQIIFKDVCVVTGQIEPQYCRKWFLSAHMTDNEIVRTAFMAVEKAEYHELCEKFRFNGELINNPHLNLIEVSKGITDFINLDKRK